MKTKRIYLFILIVLAFTINTKALTISYDTLHLTFQKTLGSYGEIKCMDTLNGYLYVAGAMNGKATLMKLDSNYNKVWAHGLLAGSEINSFKILPNNGGFIMAGTDYAVPGKINAAFIMKADTAGHFVAGKIIADNGTGTNAATYGNGVEVLDNYCYLIANTQGFSCANGGILFVKLDLNLNLQTSNVFGNEVSSNSITKTLDGRLVICGFNDYTNGGDLILIKIDTSGNQLWSKYYGGSSTDIGYSVIATSDSNFVAVGETDDTLAQGGRDVFVVKTNKYGDTLWAKYVGSSTREIGYAVTEIDSGYIISGYDSQAISEGVASCKGFITLINKDGKILMSKDLDSIANGNIVCGYSILYKNGKIIMGGVYNNIPFLVKTNLYSNSCNETNPNVTSTSIPIMTGNTTLTKTAVIPEITILSNTETNITPTTFTICYKDTLIIDTTNQTDTTVYINNNNKILSVSIFPNPIKEILTLETNSNKEQKIEIVNLIGQTVYTNIINKKATINTSAFAKGVYILKLSSDKEKVVRKFVKE